MSVVDLWTLLLETLQTQKLRSALTVLGIVIGIASMVLLSSIGEGTREGIAKEFTQFGTTIVSIMPGKSETHGNPGYMGGTTYPLTYEDALVVRRVRGVRWYSPTATGVGEVEAGERSRHTYIFGVINDAQHVWQWYPRVGSFIPDGDPDHIPPVCALGPKTARELFPNQNPLGAHVRVADARFKVVGVMEPKGQMLGWDLDDAVYIPLKRAMRLFNRDQLQELHLYVTSHSMIPRVMSDVKAVLKDRHDGNEDFTVISQADMLKVIEDVLIVVTVGVMVIAAISVFVGAMGILTIMWISVHERTQEIGLVKALGASNRQVLTVFLSEAAALSLLGGVAGLLFGWGGCRLLQAAIPGFWVQTPAWMPPVALGVSLFVGVVAGVVPAIRASRLDPIEALRAE